MQIIPRINMNTEVAGPIIAKASDKAITTAAPRSNPSDGAVLPPRPAPTPTAITNMQLFQQLVKYGNELKAKDLKDMQDRYSAENQAMNKNIIRDMR